MLNIFDGIALSFIMEEAWEKHTQGAEGSFLKKKP